jgi:hypothetical protein
MKTLLQNLIIILFIYALAIQASELPKDAGPVKLDVILKKSAMSLEQLKDANQSVILGELTGAGRSIPLERMRGLLLNDKVVRDIEIKDFRLIKEEKGLVADLVQIITDKNETLKASQFIGVIVQN